MEHVEVAQESAESLPDVSAPPMGPDGPGQAGRGESTPEVPPLPELPPAPLSIEELGIPDRFLEDLTLKTLSRLAVPTPIGLANALRIPPGIARGLIDGLRHGRLVETTAASGRLESEWQYRLTDQGLHAASNAFERNRYVGPVPVPLPEYLYVVAQDSEVGKPYPPLLLKLLSDLVLDREIVSRVSLALTSGRPAMLYGAPGNGKTTILDRCSDAILGATLLPMCIFANGQVIRMYDPLTHVSLDGDDDASATFDDRRWLRIRRPFVFVGGEMRFEDLDLAYDVSTGEHQAPAHVRAHGGLLAIDDFGRQQVTPSALLNRWIAALQRGEDTLSLVTGERVTLPFRSTICFSTNIEPHEMLEEAHLRRIPYKVRIPPPTTTEMAEIFRRFAVHRGVAADDTQIASAVNLVSRASRNQLRSCHPGDILQLVIEEAAFLGKRPVLDSLATRHACEIYFGVDPGDA